MVGGFGFVVMFVVFLYNRRLAKRIKSQAIDSVAKDNLSDALVSAGATIGIIGLNLACPGLIRFWLS